MAGILGIEYTLPPDILSNDILAEEYKTWSSDKIAKKTGITDRHIAGKGITAADLGIEAARKLIGSERVKKEEIDFLIFVTQTPDYILPPSACMIQDALGLSKRCGSFDINLGCSGFVYGLLVASGLVDSGIAKNVMLVTAETYSKHINKRDKSTRTLFGDGAAATLIGSGGIRIGSFDYGTDGSGKDLLIIPAGGARKEKSDSTGVERDYDGNIRCENNLFMDGPGILDFTLREVPNSIERLLKKERLDRSSVDLYVFHQANEYILRVLQRKMDIEDKRFYVGLKKVGNTVSASIPIALKMAAEEGLLEEKKRVLLCGFGVGLSWGTTILYSEEKNDFSEI